MSESMNGQDAAALFWMGFLAFCFFVLTGAVLIVVASSVVHRHSVHHLSDV